MKVAYAACDVSKTKESFAEKLNRVFLPSGRAIGRLVKRQDTSSRCTVEVRAAGRKVRASFSNHTKNPARATVTGARDWQAKPIEAVYVPVKEMLAHGPGFRSLYAQREIHYEEVYADILDRAYRPVPRGAPDTARQRLLKILRQTIAGRVVVKNEEFFLRSRQGNLEFTLLAEGMRKLALLWLLILNGTLLNGSVLFWDEPEANLNPALFGKVIQVLLELQREGVQVFLATHNYVILKELDLQRQADDQVLFHSLYRDADGELAHHAAATYLEIHPNSIEEAFTSLYDRQVKRSLAAFSK